MKKILIIEGHADIHRLIRMTLAFDNYDISEAGDGDSGPAMALVLLSARGCSEDLDAGLWAGAEAYLVKPFGPFQLIECIGQELAAA